MELLAPSEKEVVILQDWESLIVVEGDAVQERVISVDFGITHQAAIARLSGLVRKGWLQTRGAPKAILWELTPAGAEGIGFFANDLDFLDEITQAP